MNIDEIDSVLINNQYRKRILSYYYDAGRENISFVEGIGNMERGLLFSFDKGAPDRRAQPVLLCLYQHDNLIYKKYEDNPCFLKDDGLDNIDEIIASDFDIYPTITKDKLYLKTSQIAFVNYQIYDTQGKLCLNGTSQDTTIDVSLLHIGMYFIVLQNGNTRYTHKLIKQ